MESCIHKAILCPVAFSLFLLTSPLSASRVEIREGQFFVDGAPFYVRAIGYVGLRPHQTPGPSYAGVNYALTDSDFKRIKAARFNTIRTWDALEPQELELARKHGLWVLQGIRIDPRQDFANPRNRENAAAQARLAAESSRPFDNVLGYLLGSKTHPAAAAAAGPAGVTGFFRDLRAAIHEVDSRPVAMDGWIPAAFVDHSGFDFVSFNLFDFWPRSMMESIGFSGALRWVKYRFGPDLPLLVSATGGYAVSTASATPLGGFGGLQEYDQSARDLAALRDTVEGHAAGSVLVSWIDSWWAAGDAGVHDQDPWEWTGVLAIETDSVRDREGRPRKIYRDLAAFNALVILEPKANHLYPGGSPLLLRASTSPDAVFAQFSVNGGDWRHLEGSGTGNWQAFVGLDPKAKRRQRITVRALDRHQSVLMQKEVSFVYAVEPERLSVLPQRTKGSGGTLQFTAQWTDASKKPLANRKIVSGCFYPVSLRESRGTGATDESGRVAIHCSAPAAEDRYVYVAAGGNTPDLVRIGDWQIFELAH